MKMVNGFIFVVLMNFTLLYAGETKFLSFIKNQLYDYESKSIPDNLDAVMITTLFSHKLSDMNIEEKIVLAYDLYKIMQDSEAEDSNKKLQLSLIEEVFKLIDLENQKEINKMRQSLSSIGDGNFTQYLSGFFENDEEQSNINLKKMFLSVLLDSQLQLSAAKEKNLNSQAQDLVKEGMDLIYPSKEDEDLVSEDLLNTLIISTSFEQSVDQEEAIEKERKELESLASSLNKQQTAVLTMKLGLKELLEQYNKDISISNRPLSLKLYLGQAQKVLGQQLISIKNDFDSLLERCDEVENRKQGAQQNRVQWGSLLQEKLDKKNQEQQEAETKMQTLQRAMDELENKQKILSDKNEALKESKRLLVKTNLKQALEQKVFDPENYTT